MTPYRLAAAAALAACVAITTGATILITTRSEAAALVGKSSRVDLVQKSTSTIDQLKALYRRPEAIPFPKENPYTPAKAALGKNLFFDTRLSVANLLSCASCHNPAFSWGDGQPRGIGHGMNRLERRSPTIVNAAFARTFMWDGRADSLEEQALGPIQAAVEMNMSLEELVKRIGGIRKYVADFEGVFPGESITAVTIAKAIATYERMIVSGRAPFDAWIEGDEQAISAEAKNGFLLFNSKAGCSACHGDWNFTDDSFHDTGLPGVDVGRGKFFAGVVKMQRAFKTPGLREITRRGPFMHDGSLPTLRAVVDHYDNGGIDRESRSDSIKPLGLSEQEKNDLIALLNTLSSEVDPTVVPLLPR
jgi:cytochrome c peroxidase